MSSGSFPLARQDGPPARLRSPGLNWARAAAIVGQTLLLSAARESPGAATPTFLLASGVAAAAAASMFALMHLRRQATLDDRTLFTQLLVDLMVLTYMLALSGGPDNPFLDAYFLPIAVAAATLAARYAWCVAAAALGCYTFVQFVYLPLPGTPAALGQALGVGEWGTHVVLALVATYFLQRITRDLRERERQLGDAREAASRAECAVAIGSIAAGAAHELSTPLMTIAVLVEELRRDPHDPAQVEHGLELMLSAVGECRRTLDVLRQAHGAWRPASGCLPLRRFVDEILTRFNGMRPGLAVATTIDARPGEPDISVDVALQQAVINLLVNAAAVSPQHIGLHVCSDVHELTIRVSDRGPGIAPPIVEQLGRSFVSTKAEGGGMGLFLTQITTKRLGGRFSIRNAAERGAVAEIVLPLGALQP